METRVKGGKSRSKICNSDRKAGYNRDRGEGLRNRDRSRIEVREELNIVKGK
jgi:hypothetical protein